MLFIFRSSSKKKLFQKPRENTKTDRDSKIKIHDVCQHLLLRKVIEATGVEPDKNKKKDGKRPQR